MSTLSNKTIIVWTMVIVFSLVSTKNFWAPCQLFDGEKAGVPLLPLWIRVVKRDKRNLLWLNQSVPRCYSCSNAV